MTPDLEQRIAEYGAAGYIDVADYQSSSTGQLRPAFLALSSGFPVDADAEVLVTATCWHAFKASGIDASPRTRFHLLDLKLGNSSMFTRAEPLVLRDLAVGREPVPRGMSALIDWPLPACPIGTDVSARAAIPSHVEGRDPGHFELLLIGTAIE